MGKNVKLGECIASCDLCFFIYVHEICSPQTFPQIQISKRDHIATKLSEMIALLYSYTHITFFRSVFIYLHLFVRTIKQSQYFPEN